MSQDEYRVGDRRTLVEYPCGLRAGDRLRLKADLRIEDAGGHPTGVVLPAGKLWTVVRGLTGEPDTVWLHEPDGKLHTWDETVLDSFDLVASAPSRGAHVVLLRSPPWISGLPAKSQRLFELCADVPLRVLEIDDSGLVVLDAGEFDNEVGGTRNDIRVEAELVVTAESGDRG